MRRALSNDNASRDVNELTSVYLSSSMNWIMNQFMLLKIFLITGFRAKPQGGNTYIKKNYSPCELDDRILNLSSDRVHKQKEHSVDYTHDNGRRYFERCLSQIWYPRSRTRASSPCEEGEYSTSLAEMLIWPRRMYDLCRNVGRRPNVLRCVPCTTMCTMQWQGLYTSYYDV